MRKSEIVEYFLDTLMKKFGDDQEFDIVDVIDTIDAFLTFFIVTASDRAGINEIIQDRIELVNKHAKEDDENGE